MFKWKENYSVGVKALDEQHQKLFEIGSNLVDLMNSGDIDQYDNIINLLSELYNYSVYHFDSEEKLLKENGIEIPVKHLKEHHDFIQKLEESKIIDIDNNQKKILMDLLAFVADWITVHILKTDKDYMIPLNAKGVY